MYFIVKRDEEKKIVRVTRAQTSIFVEKLYNSLIQRNLYLLGERGIHECVTIDRLYFGSVTGELYERKEKELVLVRHGTIERKDDNKEKEKQPATR